MAVEEQYLAYIVLRHGRPELDEVVVTDLDGGVVANRPIPLGANIPDGVDQQLRQLGFRRVGGWRSGREWLTATVRRLGERG